MDTIVYTSCTLTSTLCAWLLLRFFYRTRYRLLFWSGLCFVGLAISNLVLVLDEIVYPEFNLGPYRLVIALGALLPLMYGLIFEE